jgi:hypothetical protein
VAHTQRERYPTKAKQGQTRLEACPALYQNPRVYKEADEPNLWSIERVRTYLAKGRWPRFVSKIGQITLYGKAYRVGRAFAHQQVWLRFDGETNEWIIQNAEGKEIIRHLADQITKERICSLTVAKPRPLSKKEQMKQQAKQTKQQNSITQQVT